MQHYIKLNFEDSIAMIALWKRHRDEVYDDAINNIGFHSDAADDISNKIGDILACYDYVPLITVLIFDYEAIRQELHDLPKMVIRSLKKDEKLPEDIEIYLRLDENM